MIFSNKKKDKIFIHLTNISSNVQASASFFDTFEIKNTNNVKIFSTTMKDYEVKGDSHIHDIIMDLNKTFITPIESEDLLQLVIKMDDILDGLEHCSSCFEMYNIIQPDEYIHNLSTFILKATNEMMICINLLTEKNFSSIRTHAIKMKDYETQADHILRSAIKQLFLNETNLIKIIQYKEVYELLEQVTDSCQDVANTLETIIMKN